MSQCPKRTDYPAVVNGGRRQPSPSLRSPWTFDMAPAACQGRARCRRRTIEWGRARTVSAARQKRCAGRVARRRPLQSTKHCIYPCRGNRRVVCEKNPRGGQSQTTLNVIKMRRPSTDLGAVSPLQNHRGEYLQREQDYSIVALGGNTDVRKRLRLVNHSRFASIQGEHHKAHYVFPGESLLG